MSATTFAAKAAKMPSKPKVQRWVLLIGLIIVALLFISPFIIMLLNAFKSPADYSANGPLSVPTELYVDGLSAFWNRVGFGGKLWNSVWTSGLVAVFAVLLSLLNAYAIGIGRIKGRLSIVAL